MKTAAIFVLVVAVIGLGILAYFQEASLRELREKVEHVPKKATLELQEKCARQARQDFIQLGWDKDPLASFSNHYNERLNKCFMLLADTDYKTAAPDVFHNKHLEDAFEGKVFGEYSWKSQKDKGYWDVPPLECTVTLPSGEQKLCHASEEFDDLIKAYME
jgi:hypothetical protein